MDAISEFTKIRLSLVIVLAGGIAWLTSLKADTISLKEKIENLERNESRYLQMQEEIRDRLSHIEGMLRKSLRE